MTKHTTRDEIWKATVQTVAAAREGGAGGFRGDRVTIDEVVSRLDCDPSRRTVRDTLNTMEDMGFLESLYSQGEYDTPDDPIEVTAGEQSA